MNVGDWIWLPATWQAGLVVTTSRLWGTNLVEVWLPARGTTFRVTADQVQSLEHAATRMCPANLVYTAAAVRIADSLERDVLAAPLECPVIPAPDSGPTVGRLREPGPPPPRGRTVKRLGSRSVERKVVCERGCTATSNGAKRSIGGVRKSSAPRPSAPVEGRLQRQGVQYHRRRCP